MLNQDRFDTMMAHLLNDIAADTDIIKTDYTAQMEEKPEIAHKMQFSIPKLLIIIGIVKQ